MAAKIFDAKGVDELSVVSDYLIELKRQCNIMAFYGQMGAGKTTLIKNICRKLGVSEEVNSPTFALVNEYFTDEGESVFHFDFYRIKKLEEVYDIGYEDYFYGDALCLLEWPELIAPLMPEHYIKVTINPGADDNSRVISCELI